jgi:hypothetical protein
MLRQFVDKIIQRFRGMHEDQGGAMALMCLAACLILFMISLVLYDTGKATREKIQVQTSSDIAAYSHAAIKARTMNMIAMSNVAKRSIMSIYMVYTAAWAAYLVWWGGRCSSCSIWNPGACWDCISNLPLVLAEGATDAFKLAGLPASPVQFSFGSANKYNAELKQLTTYQEYMATITPWWAYMESMVGGVRNGASAVSSFPQPPGVVSGGLNIVNDILSILQSFGIGGGSLYAQTGHRGDYVPSKPVGNLLDFLTPSLCIDASPIGIVADPAFAVEVAIYTQKQRSRSQLGAKNHNPNAYWVEGIAQCGILLGHVQLGLPILSGPFKKADTNPYRYSTDVQSSRVPPRPSPNSAGEADWAKTNSNLMFTYKAQPNNMGVDREKYNFIRKDYDTSLMTKPSGYWTMSRGEYYYRGPKILFDTVTFKSNVISHWHAGWTARLRPVALNDAEWNAYGSGKRFTLNAAFHDTAPYLGLQMLLGLISGGTLSSSIKDFVFLEKTSRNMDNKSHNGIFR